MSCYTDLLRNFCKGIIVVIIKIKHEPSSLCENISVKTVVSNTVVEGVAKSTEVSSVNEIDRKMNLYAFIEWAKERNKVITAKTDYKSIANASRKDINDAWKTAMEDSSEIKISKKTAKKAIQNVFDSLIFIAGKSGKNAVVANGDIANYIIALAGDLKVTSNEHNPNFEIDFLKGKSWEGHIFNMLHMAVEGKTYEVVYGDPENEAAEAVEANSNTATEAEAQA